LPVKSASSKILILKATRQETGSSTQITKEKCILAEKCNQPYYLNGKVIGTWTRSLRDERFVRLIFFEKPERAVEREATMKAKVLAKLISRREPEVQVEIQP
jgi:hypothetical protein